MSESQHNNKTLSEDWKLNLRESFITAITTTDSAKKQQATEDVGYYYKCCAPAFLYKYYSGSIEKLETVINNSMWYSAPSCFNDVFDCDYSIDEDSIFQGFLSLYADKKILPGSQVWRELRKVTNKEIKSFRTTLSQIRDTTGVSCLSEADDSILMWAHYAHNHQGMCVEYDLARINSSLQFTPVPIIYSGEKTCLRSIDIDNTGEEMTRFLIHMLTTKSKDWHYEKEWRIIREDSACGSSWDNEKHGALLEMIPPSSIILGCEASIDLENLVREYCSTNRISLYRMGKDTQSYRLNKNALLQFD